MHHPAPLPADLCEDGCHRISPSSLNLYYWDDHFQSLPEKPPDFSATLRRGFRPDWSPIADLCRFGQVPKQVPISSATTDPPRHMLAAYPAVTRCALRLFRVRIGLAHGMPYVEPKVSAEPAGHFNVGI